MRQSTRTRQAALALSCALFAAILMVACGGSMTPNPLQPTVATITALPSDTEMLSEKTIGSASAANTIVEYVSFWCSGCRNFYLTGDGSKLKSQFADTSKAQIVFRSLFLSGESPAAAMLARCAGNARFFDAVNTLFTNQSTFAGSSNPDLTVGQVMLGFGMSQSVVNACVADTTLQNGLIQIHQNATQATYLLPDGTSVVGFNAVPAVVVNGIRLDGTNADGTANSDNAPTLANIQKYFK